MSPEEAARRTAETIAGKAGFAPRTALILGSGLSGLADRIEGAVEIAYADLEGFPRPSVSGHAGRLVLGRIGGTEVAVMAGRSHFYEHGRSDAMRPALAALAALGVETLFLTNAAGSLHEEMPPGSLMQIVDHIGFFGVNPLIGETSDGRFVGMTEAYDRQLAMCLQGEAQAEGIELHQGVYLWVTGPSFETPAEIRAAHALGADAVGMSTVPEVILARYLGMKVAAFSVITNLAAGMTGRELSHDETKELAPQGGRKLEALLARHFAKVPA
ncbi:purine-nucleoside phosphorylase [Afifella sp. IM 167]|uniref:purine-nucleoside phosphorylase n=1 Tax=Afifella sp. IM 167 TaxID=2033586 RepID=UPI001CCC842B|nr:purine-nucleoside phosphorylase [Afifella sp. IM 167]MBZ8135456.1 purine-nucleoside phosphorylase [Afifella sp. IM 167]